MCLPKPPKIPEPIPGPTQEELWETSPSNPKNQLATPVAAPPPPVVAPPQAINPTPAAPAPPSTPLDIPTPPPVTTKTGTEDQPLITKKKSKRKELQQQNRGTSALRIPLAQAIGGATGSTGSTGLNIPK